MTMKASAKKVSASEFKTHCLRLLDHVARTGEPLLVTKRGRPLARIVAVLPERAPPLRGSVRFHGDIVAPILDRWDLDL
jgi:prevent-host-death family protein